MGLQDTVTCIEGDALKTLHEIDGPVDFVFLDYIQTSPDYDTVIIRASMEKNDGMSISYKIR